jgi:GNAT superfamily N-acetyltransferase
MGPAAEAVALASRPIVEIPERTAFLEDRRAVVLRSATTADLAGIVDFFERLSSPSRYLRFFSPQPRLRRAFIERVVAPGADRMTMLAQPAEFRATGRRVIAVASWIHVPADDRCDVSIAVADEWQGVMLGTYLMLALLQHAVESGHTRFAADVLNGNGRMLGLLRDLRMPTRVSRDAGVVRVEFEIPAPQ